MTSTTSRDNLPTVRVFTARAGGTTYHRRAWRVLAPQFCSMGHTLPGVACGHCPEVS